MPEVSDEEIVVNVAMTLLHKMLSENFEVVLTQADFGAMDAARARGEHYAVNFRTNEREDIILTQVKSKADA